VDLGSLRRNLEKRGREKNKKVNCYVKIQQDLEMEIHWSGWKIFHMNDLSSIPEKRGVYQFRCPDDDKTPKTISRLLDKDIDGIIYVVKSDNLSRRINAFWKTVTKRDRSRHAAAWTYCSYDYESIFLPDRLQIRYFVGGDPECLEFDLLLEYFKRFKDLPPLNSSRGKYPNDWKKKFAEIFGRKPLPA
jgi:hypothetical protein